MTFIEDCEEVEKLATDWAFNLIGEIVETLSHGKPYGLEPQTKSEKLDEYNTIRGNPQGWYSWMESNIQTLVQKLHESGLDDKQIAQAHPYDVVIRLAMDYSKKMEAALTNG